jgi:terminase small subunit-like protein
VQAVGLLVTAPTAKLPIQSPWLAIMNRQAEIARKLAAELALPPAQRSRAGMAPPRDAVRPDDGWSF